MKMRNRIIKAVIMLLIITTFPLTVNAQLSVTPINSDIWGKILKGNIYSPTDLLNISSEYLHKGAEQIKSGDRNNGLTNALIGLSISRYVNKRDGNQEAYASTILLQDIFERAGIENATILASEQALNDYLNGEGNISSKEENAESELSAQKAVLRRLKDPESARFGQFTQVSNLACLSVNARNAMGGYSGEQQAVLMRLSDTWLVVGFHNTSHESCVYKGIPAAQKVLSK